MLSLEKTGQLLIWKRSVTHLVPLEIKSNIFDANESKERLDNSQKEDQGSNDNLNNRGTQRRSAAEIADMLRKER